jgi:hypothetical protein
MTLKKLIPAYRQGRYADLITVYCSPITDNFLLLTAAACCFLLSFRYLIILLHSKDITFCVQNKIFRWGKLVKDVAHRLDSSLRSE